MILANRKLSKGRLKISRRSGRMGYFFKYSKCHEYSIYTLATSKRLHLGVKWSNGGKIFLGNKISMGFYMYGLHIDFVRTISK